MAFAFKARPCALSDVRVLSLVDLMCGLMEGHVFQVAMIVHHGHMYQNWAEVNGTGCFRATPCLMAPSPPGKPPVCHTDCRWWDLNNVTDYVHNTLEMVTLLLDVLVPSRWVTSVVPLP